MQSRCTGQRLGDALLAFPLLRAEAGAYRIRAGQIVKNSSVFQKCEVLRGEYDPVPECVGLIFEPDRRTVQQDLALIGFPVSGENIGQNCFPSSVFADDPVKFTGIDCKIDMTQYLHVGKDG